MRSDIVKCFTTSELMRWPGVQELYGPALRRTKVFGPAGTTGVDGDVEEADEGGEARWEELHSRVVEHVRLRAQPNRKTKRLSRSGRACRTSASSRITIRVLPSID